MGLEVPTDAVIGALMYTSSIQRCERIPCWLRASLNIFYDPNTPVKNDERQTEQLTRALVRTDEAYGADRRRTFGGLTFVPSH